MMIDYDKLKIAHTFIDKCESHYLAHINSKKHGHEYTLVDWKIEMPDLIYDNIDDLITKLRELTQSEPKYKVGDVVFIVDAGNELAQVEFMHDEYYGYGAREPSDGYFIDEKHCYPNKAALIEAQIEYWSNMQYSQEPLPINNGGRGERELNPTFKATDSWYKQAAKDEDEYCNVSGAKLGKNLPTHGVGSALKVDLNGKPAWVDTNTKREECEHETDWNQFKQDDQGYLFKCEKCGEFYL